MTVLLLIPPHARKPTKAEFFRALRKDDVVVVYTTTASPKAVEVRAFPYWTFEDRLEQVCESLRPRN
jgi:hypothetical protein